MTATSQEDRERWRALAEAATAMAWFVSEDGREVRGRYDGTHSTQVALTHRRADSELFAAAREAVPALLAERDELVRERDEALAAVATVRALHSPRPCPCGPEPHEPKRTSNGEVWCYGPDCRCGDTLDYPCATIRALDGAS